MKKSLVKLVATSAVALTLSGAAVSVFAEEQDKPNEPVTASKGVTIDEYNKKEAEEAAKKAAEEAPKNNLIAEGEGKLANSNLSKEDKEKFTKELKNQETAYDVDQVNQKIDKAIADNKAVADAEFVARKEKVQKAIYESKVSEELKNSLNSAAVAAKNEAELNVVIANAKAAGVEGLPSEAKVTPENGSVKPEQKPETKPETKPEQKPEESSKETSKEADKPAAKPAKKDEKKAELPQTGEASTFAIAGAAVLSALAGLGFVAKKEN